MLPRLTPDEILNLRGKVAALEADSTFPRFLEIVRNRFTTEGYHSKNLSFWKSALRNFIRRSEYYLNLAKSTPIDTEQILSKMTEAFQTKTRQVTYVAPMEFVRFSNKPLEFRLFTIRSYTSSELESLLQNQVNEAFYPSHHATTTDLGRLTWYSFIVVTETEPAERLGRFGTFLADVGKVNIKFSEHPPIEKALKQLALVDWEANWLEPTADPDSEWEQWERFSVPFVFRVTDDLLSYPSHRINTSQLTTTSYVFIDPETGEPDEEEGPDVRISLDTEQGARLQAYVRKVDDALLKVESAGSSWAFYDRALSFLVKAFSTYELEQLLWHIAAIESILGEKKTGVTNRLVHRVSIILGDTEATRKEARSQFLKLYEFRSQLVHGAEFEQQIWEGHLRKARNVTRQVLVWFLYYLENITGQVRASSEQPTTFPSHEELLLMLDMKPTTRETIARHLPDIPTSFPNLPSWLD